MPLVCLPGSRASRPYRAPRPIANAGRAPRFSNDRGYSSSLILTLRNQTGAPACFPCRPILPLVGRVLRGLLSQAGTADPSGFVLADVHRLMSIEVTCSSLSITSILWSMHRMVNRFHSPGFFTALLVGAKRPKMAPQCHVGGALAHCGSKSSAI